MFNAILFHASKHIRIKPTPSIEILHAHIKCFYGATQFRLSSCSSTLLYLLSDFTPFFSITLIVPFPYSCYCNFFCFHPIIFSLFSATHFCISLFCSASHSHICSYLHSEISCRPSFFN